MKDVGDAHRLTCPYLPPAHGTDNAVPRDIDSAGPRRPNGRTMMRAYHVRLGTALAAWFAIGCEQSPTVIDAGPADFAVAPVESERHVVVLRDGVEPSAIARSVRAQPLFVYRVALNGFSAPLTDAMRRRLERLPIVRWIEPVRTFELFTPRQAPLRAGLGHGADGVLAGVPSLPGVPGLPGRPAGSRFECSPGPGDPTTHDDLTELWGIRRVNAPLSATWTNEPVAADIAILDTGADLDHPDLCVHRAVSFAPLEPTAEDLNGHGTHVSGTAAARDDNGLVVGVAPESRLWEVKVCSVVGVCFNDAIIAGIDWVAQRADTIFVANMSVGGPGSDQAHAPNECEAIVGDAMHAAICRAVRAGVTFVVAAGNDGADASNTVPAAYDEVITVAAMDSLDRAASFSNFGADIDLIAPGVSILSDFLFGTTVRLSGTSMASPHVAGGAALYIAQQLNAGNPRPSPFAVRDALVAAGQPWRGQGGGSHPEPLLDVRSF
ncbi:MAG: S8 family serine peptidase [Longimicrobiales bacterium]